MSVLRKFTGLAALTVTLSLGGVALSDAVQAQTTGPTSTLGYEMQRFRDPEGNVLVYKVSYSCLGSNCVVTNVELVAIIYARPVAKKTAG